MRQILLLSKDEQAHKATTWKLVQNRTKRFQQMLLDCNVYTWIKSIANYLGYGWEHIVRHIALVGVAPVDLLIEEITITAFKLVM